MFHNRKYISSIDFFFLTKWCKTQGGYIISKNQIDILIYYLTPLDLNSLYFFLFFCRDKVIHDIDWHGKYDRGVMLG